MNKKFVYRWKEDRSQWWRLEGEIDRPDTSESSDPNDPDHYWIVKLYESKKDYDGDDAIIKAEVTIWAQYDTEPELSDCIIAISADLNTSLLGFIAGARIWTHEN